MEVGILVEFGSCNASSWNVELFCEQVLCEWGKVVWDAVFAV